MKKLFRQRKIKKLDEAFFALASEIIKLDREIALRKRK